MLINLIDNLGQDGTPCEKVIGSTPNVDSVAAFNDSHAKLVHLIGLSAIINYVEEKNFTPDEFAAFKKGLSAFGTFFNDCSLERQARREKKKQQQE